MAYQGRTVVSELRERVRDLGGDPKGKTHAQLLDELQKLSGGGASADVSEQVSRAIGEQLPAAIEEQLGDASLDEVDWDRIFGEG